MLKNSHNRPQNFRNQPQRGSLTLFLPTRWHGGGPMMPVSAAMAARAIPAGIHQVRIFGTPQPVAKDEMVVCKSRDGRYTLHLIKRDYRVRTCKITGQKLKYDRGHKQAWMNLIRLDVWRYLENLKLRPFPKNHPVAWGTIFFLPKAKSNKLIVPSQPPDDDNFDYAVRNALKRTPAKRGRPGPYPDGTLYYEDDQITWRPWPGGLIWATDEHPPGLLITFGNLDDIHELMGEYDPYPKG